MANEAVVLERFTGLESVNELFNFEIEVLATSSNRRSTDGPSCLLVVPLVCSTTLHHFQ
ncbi:hypothetical protein SAMN03159339_6863 [Variovorax sp. 770b2]|nr:hypothetical protein SAMN03159339_6863 [Variovorax sp. 770b2]